MTTEQQIKEIREACLRANPEIGGTCSACGKKNPLASEPCDPPTLPHCNVNPRTIRLADVLLAIRTKKEQFIDHDNERSVDDGIADWNETLDELVSRYQLSADDLTEQSPETISFIHSLLTV